MLWWWCLSVCLGSLVLHTVASQRPDWVCWFACCSLACSTRTYSTSPSNTASVRPRSGCGSRCHGRPGREREVGEFAGVNSGIDRGGFGLGAGTIMMQVVFGEHTADHSLVMKQGRIRAGWMGTHARRDRRRVLIVSAGHRHHHLASSRIGYGYPSSYYAVPYGTGSSAWRSISLHLPIITWPCFRLPTCLQVRSPYGYFNTLPSQPHLYICRCPYLALFCGADKTIQEAAEYPYDSSDGVGQWLAKRDDTLGPSNHDVQQICSFLAARDKHCDAHQVDRRAGLFVSPGSWLQLLGLTTCS